jgi:hypothetical protein
VCACACVDKAVWVGRARVHMQQMHAWTTVLWCAVVGADGGGGLLWPELMVVAACMCGPHVKLSCGLWCSVVRPGEVR